MAAEIQGEFIGLVAVGGAFAVAIIGIISGTIRKTLGTRAREESRREIAAYIAEGTMTPDDGVRLMAAGAKQDKKNGCC